ncbi:hypothetical protein [Streptomyces sp. WMMC897]|uniref:hypothetical protein n=1 Tax=Streptomyces sp. WMMC897 TaxID=3014782 RepID=UPI0022B5E5FE|nr:hypothetical protein [Streptomyces sp. WMMC897]MCZ7414272.1 hypothetical protein [Streptomyces sp. WMMC897]
MDGDAAETLAQLVDEAVRDRGLTFAALSGACVDPETGYRPSANLLWTIARRKPVKINPPLINAIAVGLRKPILRVQVAAAFEYTGLRPIYVSGGVVLASSEEPSSLAKARAVMDVWDAEEAAEDEGNHPAR